jgi:chromosome segregation ATPase
MITREDLNVALKTLEDNVIRYVGIVKEDTDRNFSILREQLVFLSESFIEMKDDVGILKEDVGTLKIKVNILKEDMLEVKGDIAGIKEELVDVNKELKKKADRTDIVPMVKRIEKLELRQA